MIVGAAVLTPARPHPSEVIPPWEVAALGIAPAVRGRRLGSALLQTAVAGVKGDPVTATIGVAERDPVDPLPVETRTAIARRLLDQAGFRVRPAEGAVGQVDAAALTARHG
jgi:GNAT superfamily N-acetyltransferase